MTTRRADGRGALLAMGAACALGMAFEARAAAATLDWKGHTWQVTSGAMAGVCKGSPDNVSIDANGYLHFKISNNAGTWTASEIFTTDKLGFGTYQWQVDGPIDTYDKNVVLGLFPYGPQAAIGEDGTNEIDIEYSRWAEATGPNADWTDYPAAGKTIGELAYEFSLGGATLSTSRFAWSKTSITSSLLAGLAPVDSAAGLIKTWTYAPPEPTMNIPQQALPLGMNLWCFDAPPSDGKPVEIVIRDFQFIPAGSATSADGGADGIGAGGDASAADAGAGGADAGAGGADAAARPDADAAAAEAGVVGGAAGAQGAGGAAGAAGASGASGHAGAARAGGCSLGGARADGSGALGLVLLALRRRRRRHG